jgi:hypothetical protein
MNINTLKGETLTSVVRGEYSSWKSSSWQESSSGDALLLTTQDGKEYVLFHEQDCCENVTLEDECGDWADIIGNPLLISDERIVTGEEDYGDSWTATFYEFATIRGTMTLRWHGMSNGYYSEAVYFEEKK